MCLHPAPPPILAGAGRVAAPVTQATVPSKAADGPGGRRDAPSDTFRTAPAACDRKAGPRRRPAGADAAITRSTGIVDPAVSP